MATLTLKKKSVTTSEIIGKFALMRKPKESKRMFFAAFHDSYRLAEIERERLKSVTENSTFYIVCVVSEG